ncbi:MAG TPA: hypothetical protein PKA98_03995 [Acidimicrobiales bacterium]|nr:hypothetical protein [Acidimicrobiales bacterium]
MAATRRTVRVAREVFDVLDDVLGDERGPNGEPSVGDFLSIELLAIVDNFAERFDELPEAVPGHPELRVLIVAGTLVPAVATVGCVDAIGEIELVWIRLDLSEAWD